MGYFRVRREIFSEDSVFTLIRQDINQFAHGPRLRDKVKVIVLSHGFLAVFLVRVQTFLYAHRLLTLAYMVYRSNLILTGLDALPGCKIGGGLRIEHPVGIVIGAGAIIGSGCTILQGVTIGVKHVSREENDNQYPTIGDNVTIGAKASILGGVFIGSNSVIGAHALVLGSAPDGSFLVGIVNHPPQTPSQANN